MKLKIKITKEQIDSIGTYLMNEDVKDKTNEETYKFLHYLFIAATSKAVEIVEDCGEIIENMNKKYSKFLETRQEG